jgi:hypothetical protein
VGKKTVTETHFGNTLIIVTAECSPTATETIEKKLERLIVRHFSDLKTYQDDGDNRVAMFSNQSEYGSDTI